MIEDIFNEANFTPIKGLIRRYPARVLIELTLKCPVDCEFCYRKWKKRENKEGLSKNDIDNIVEYIVQHREITEVIFSGGEPLMVMDLLDYAFKKLKVLDQIKVFRIHTRAVVTAPWLVSEKFLKILRQKCKQVVYLSIHINHYKELNSEVELVIRKIRKTGVILYSQSVFLKGENDSAEVLEKLFSRLIELGVRPYNIYRCNRIKGIEQFIVPLEKEIKIMTELKRKLSGLACPTLIYDAPGSADKIPVPLNFWKDNKSFLDFNNNLIEIDE